MCNEKPPTKQLQTRINLNYIPLSRLHIDLKIMPQSNKGHKFTLCIIDEGTNYLITVPIYQLKSEEIGNGLIRVCHSTILHSRLYNHGSRQHIYVITYELFV